MKENGTLRLAKETAWEFKYGKMDLFMKVHGRKIRLVEREG